jgi:hypothetical protein
MTTKTLTPFGLLDLQEIKMSERGYKSYPDKIVYDPTSQTTDLIDFGGKTEPTTTSNCADTTGNIFSGYDSDQANDDTGTD